jgi:type IV pilus assembly protein PilA
MLKNRWWIAVAALAVSTVACSKKNGPQQISKEAAAAFGHVEASGMGGALVVDAEAMKGLGFGATAEQEQAGGAMIDLAASLLPLVATELKNDPEGPMLARAAVLVALIREWGIAPHAQRLGVVVQVSPLNPEASVDRSLVLLAVKEDEKDNREMLQSLGAAVRAASGRDLVRNKDGDLCAAHEALPEVPFQVCIHPGPGYFALGTAEGIATLGTPAAQAASRDPGPVLHLTVNVPLQGRGELTIEGRGALRVAGVFEPENKQLAEEAEQAMKKALAALDGQRDQSRKVMAGALQEVQTSIASDPDAPGRMKSAVKAATVEQVIDPQGDYAAIRKSIKIERKDRTLTAEVIVPEGLVKRYARTDPGVMTSVAMVGVLSAIAIPNFLKYQLRSKASEVPAVLTGLVRAEQAQAQLTGKYVPVAGIPASKPSSRKVVLTPAELKTAQDLDWLIEGTLYGRYTVEVVTRDGVQAASLCGETDLDDDGLRAQTVVFLPGRGVEPPPAPCSEPVPWSSEYEPGKVVRVTGPNVF